MLNRSLRGVILQHFFSEPSLGSGRYVSDSEVTEGFEGLQGHDEQAKQALVPQQSRVGPFDPVLHCEIPLRKKEGFPY